METINWRIIRYVMKIWLVKYYNFDVLGSTEYKNDQNCTIHGKVIFY